MKKIITACITIMVLSLMACSDDSSSPTSANENSNTQTTSSQPQSPTQTTTSSTPATNTNNNPSSQTSSNQSQSPSQTTSNSTTETMYVAEIGYVCNGFDFGSVDQAHATQGYVAMFQICGERATQGTGTTCYSASEVTAWMKSLNISAFSQVNTDIAIYGASFRWYNAVDGYMRYIYVEPCFDGEGLMKRGG